MACPGLPPITREDFTSQNDYMFEMGPYLRLAKAKNEEDLFYERLFKVWFERWPETPTNDSSVEDLMKIVKKVCSNNTLDVAVLTYYFLNRG